MATDTLLCSVNPWTERRYKINTYLVEYASRHDVLDALYLWLVLRAVDVERHVNPTGKLFRINDVCERVARKLCRSTKTVRRYLRKAERHSFIFVDYDLDLIKIRSRKRVTLMLRQSEPDECGHEGTVVSAHADRIGDIMEVSVTLPEIRDARSIGRSHSKILSIVRQKVTERGWGRDSLAKILGQTRRGTSRSDAVNNVRRGFQFAIIPITSITNDKSVDLVELGNKIIEGYQQKWQVTEGNGKKLWFGIHDGKPVLFTQLPVKYDTPFRGRLRPDRDVIEAVKSSGDSDMAGECWPLHPVFAEHGRDSNASRGDGILSESTRQSVWRAIRASCSDIGVKFNPSPTILIVDEIAWSLRGFGTRESSNQSSPLTFTKKVIPIEQKSLETLH